MTTPRTAEIILTVGPAPTADELRFCRKEEHLAWIDDPAGKHVGAVVFGTTTKPYKVNLAGRCFGRSASWAGALDIINDYDVQVLDEGDQA